MRLILQSVFVLNSLLFGMLALPIFAQAKEVTAEQLHANFARYASVGKGNTEIQISMRGYDGSSITRENGDGTYTCMISGLGIQGGINESLVEREMKGKFIHEYTHCLTAPYFNEPFSKPKSITESVAQNIVQLTEEGISDARALIELFRRDGHIVANEYAQFMIKERSASIKISHKTAHAITCAREVLDREPEVMRSDEHAFALALSCGKSGAQKTIQEILLASGLSDIMESAVLKSTLADIDASLLLAQDAFSKGRYDNNAVTIRHGYEGYKKGDYHVFIREDKSVEKIETLGTESANGYVELQSLIASSTQPEHRLAVMALRKHGKLSVRDLRIMSGHFSNFIRVVAQKMPQEEARAIRIIEEAITESTVGEGLDSVYNEATRRLQREFKI